MEIFKQRCVDGIEVDVDRCKDLLDRSLVLATPLAMLIGYSKAAQLSKKALAEKRGLRQVVEEEGILAPDQIEELFEGSAELAYSDIGHGR
jgi:aspartate ammonia-lyase